MFTTLSVGRKLKFNQLMIFEQVAQRGSVSHAAHALGITQSAATKIIHELESYFDEPLFFRSNRGMQVTPLGEAFRRHSRILLADINIMVDEINAICQGYCGRINIGTIVSTSTSLLPTSLQLLKQKAPDVIASIRVGETYRMLRDLAAGDLDFVLSCIPDDWLGQSYGSSVAVKKLYAEKLIIMCDLSHPMAGKKTDLASLMAYPWILPTGNSLIRSTVDRLFHEAGLKLPRSHLESVSMLTNVSLLSDGQTLTFMPMQVGIQFVRQGVLKTVDLPFPVSCGNIGCFTSLQHQSTAANTLFLQCIEQSAQTLAFDDYDVMQ